MSFTSVTFVIFFLLFFITYWFVLGRKLKLQNILILIASYVFYSWVDWRFLFILIFISLLNFILGIYIEKSVDRPSLQRGLLFIGLTQGIGGLFFFKYFDFFAISLNSLFASLHLHLNVSLINIAAPLGISFFTFKTISYLLDIYKGKIKATNDWIVFFIYLSFFPTILAGPIDRAKTFIPQLLKTRDFKYDQAAEGMRQILWGLFKKAVIADNCAVITTHTFSYYQHLPASSLLISALIYPFQLYADFSGYSDMAIGMARLLGINVTKNFDYPFFSQNIAEYWRRWHISLTSWLTEYVFTPLSISFRDLGNIGVALAIIINFAIIGIWHGANWTYLVFGILHGCYYIPLVLKGKLNKKTKIKIGKTFPSVKEFGNMLLTFFLVAFALVIFRSENMHEAFAFYKGILSKTILVAPIYDKKLLLLSIFFILMTLIFEWFNRDKDFAISHISMNWNKIGRWSFYAILLVFIIVFGADEQQFVYMKF